VGTVSGTPDTLTVGIGVSTTASTAGRALSDNNAIASAVQSALRRDGVAVRDIQTGELSIQQASPAGSGYQVYDQVVATIHELASSGKTIDDAMAVAGNDGRIDNFYLSMSETSPLMASARQQAVAAARTDAEQLASAAGEHLGSLLSLTDQPEQTQPVYYGAPSAAAGASGSPSVPVQPGSQQLSVSVTAVWSLAA
jgi:uncharacterized protein